MWPRLSIVIASASVLPPAPAHQSATRISGRAPTSAATSWLPSSWISTSPAVNAAPGGDRPPPLDAQAPGRQRRRLASIPSFASAACASSRVGLQQVDPQIERRLALHGGQLGPKRLRRSGPGAGQQPVRHVQPHRVVHRRDDRACPPCNAASGAASSGTSRSGANRPPEIGLRDPLQRPAFQQQRGRHQQPGRYRAPPRSSHQASRRRVRSTRQVRSPTARRSPEPM